MDSLRRILPSTGSLIVFEAAGRHQSFTGAGRELGMSQAAVSYAIRGMEDQLNVKLFRRAQRSVVLTEAGERFHADVSLGLARIRRGAENLQSLGRGPQVTLAGSTAFASFWMLPRLSRLREDLPDVDLRIQTSDHDLDLENEPIALGIRAGDPSTWPAYESVQLAPEVVAAIASPAYLAQHGMPERVGDLLNHRLIHLEEPIRNVCDWNTWFSSAGLDMGRSESGLRINDYVLVVQAVLEGQGVALGWKHLTGKMISSGLLVEVGSYELTTDVGFHVVWPKSRELSRSAKLVRDWLVSDAAQL